MTETAPAVAETPPPAGGKPTAAEKAAAKLQADNLAEIERLRTEERETLDAHEAAAWARAFGPAIVEGE